MNERFLFRCWDSEKKKMYYTSHLSNKYLWELPNAPVMQCTGIEDRNNTKIYEGDIVDKGYCQKESIIVWRDGMYFTKEIGMIESIFLHECVNTHEERMTFLCQTRAEDMLIIGNKYENEELLTPNKSLNLTGEKHPAG